jgi:hypothetical protein
MNATHPDPPPFWLLMLATMSRRHADFVAAVRNARRQGWRLPPRQQIMLGLGATPPIAGRGRHSPQGLAVPLPFTNVTNLRILDGRLAEQLEVYHSPQPLQRIARSL